MGPGSGTPRRRPVPWPSIPRETAAMSIAPRTLVVGAGIAGNAAATALLDLGCEVELRERALEPEGGHALLLLGNGLRALEELGLLGAVLARGACIECATIRDGDGRTSHEEPLPRCVAIARRELVDALSSRLDKARVVRGSRLVELLFDAAGAVDGARFDDGAALEADLVCGCDGGRSLVRKHVAPLARRERGQVQELVLLLDEPVLARRLGASLVKAHDLARGLAAGLAPVGGGRVVCWLQFDTARHMPRGDGPRELSEFARARTERFGPDFAAALDHGDFERAHWWRTADAAPLPRFHRGRAVLMGDAAHPFLPFTSQGANMALVDAVRLKQALAGARRLDGALAAYDRATRPDAVAHHAAGRALERHFVAGSQDIATLPRSEAVG